MQGHLRGFAHRADEQTDADQRHRRPGVLLSDLQALTRDLRCLREYRLVVERVGEIHDRRDADDEAEVPDPIDDERLEVRKDGAWARIPEADQKIRNDADRFPTEE